MNKLKSFAILNRSIYLIFAISFLSFKEVNAQKMRYFLLYGTTLSTGDYQKKQANVDSGDYLSGGFLYSLSSRISIGPSVLIHHSLNPTFKGGLNGGSTDAEKSESRRFGIMSRIHLIDRRKLELYVTGGFGYLQLNYSGYNGTLASINKDASLQSTYLSLSSGLVYKISSRIHLNIIDFAFTNSSIGEPFSTLTLNDLSTGVIIRGAKEK